MAITLGPNRYGKAEVRLVRVTRQADRHEIEDLNVSTTLSGDLADSHRSGDNAHVLPTDTQKNTVYAFARDGIGAPESFALRLARHFVATQEPITTARVHVEQYGWTRLDGSPHSFRRDGSEVRTATVTHTEAGTWVVSGVCALTLLNTTGSEFWGFARDRYTTLAESRDRILATAVDARWRWTSGVGSAMDWNTAYDAAREQLLAAFAGTYSYALQQTAYAMGSQVLEKLADVAEIRLALPNKHHYLVDLTPFGLDNPNEVFIAGDRPYGLIEVEVSRDELPPAPQAW